MTDAPCNAAEAVKRAQSMAYGAGQYWLGTGDYRPQTARCEACGANTRVIDIPWTGPLAGSDCAGFAICWCWKLTRHRPGFAKGSPADPNVSDVDDDINCNSLIEDAEGAKTVSMFLAPTVAPRPGDLLVYPTLRFTKSDGKVLTFIGHVALIESVPVAYTPGDYSSLTVLQCHGPNGFKPGVVRTTGEVFELHDVTWPKPAHRTRVIRMKERA